jgi:hypothetical protein
MQIKYIQGDLFEALKNRYLTPLFIPHVVNSKGAFGKGFVVPLGRTFPIVKERYTQWANGETSDSFQLGKTQFVLVGNLICVCNMLAQTLGGERPLYYNHLAKCMDEVAEKAEKTNGEIWAPMFGSGLAGGKHEIIEALITDCWCKRNIPVTIFHLEEIK